MQSYVNIHQSGTEIKFRLTNSHCACTSCGRVSHMQKKLSNRTHPVPGVVKQTDVNKQSGLSSRHSSGIATQDASSAVDYFMSISIVIETKSCKVKKRSRMKNLIMLLKHLDMRCRIRLDFRRLRYWSDQYLNLPWFSQPQVAVTCAVMTIRTHMLPSVAADFQMRS